MAGMKGALGDSQGEIYGLKRAIELDPHNTEYLQALGFTYNDSHVIAKVLKY